METKDKPIDFDNYISAFPKEVQERLKQVRETIHKAAPDAEEIISYKMPAYKYHGILLYFAAHKNHIGFYPSGSGIAHFIHELSEFKHATGSLQFPHDKPLPLLLIKKIVAFRIKENLEKAKFKKKRKKI